MNAPTFWQQAVIAFLVLGSIPFVLALLARLRLLPLAVYLLVVGTFPAWAAAHQTGCAVALALCVLHPVMTAALKIIRWRREEIDARNYLLATARPFSGGQANDTNMG